MRSLSNSVSVNAFLRRVTRSKFTARFEFVSVEEELNGKRIGIPRVLLSSFSQSLEHTHTQKKDEANSSRRVEKYPRPKRQTKRRREAARKHTNALERIVVELFRAMVQSLRSFSLRRAFVGSRACCVCVSFCRERDMNFFLSNINFCNACFSPRVKNKKSNFRLVTYSRAKTATPFFVRRRRTTSARNQRGRGRGRPPPSLLPSGRENGTDARHPHPGRTVRAFLG